MARSPLLLILTILALLSMVLAAPAPVLPEARNLLSHKNTKPVAREPVPAPIKGGASFSPLEALRNRGNRLPQRQPIHYYSGNMDSVREVKY